MKATVGAAQPVEVPNILRPLRYYLAFIFSEMKLSEGGHSAHTE